MPEGICKKCGKKYYGWSLQQPSQRVCDCGGEIDLAPPTLKEVVRCKKCGATFTDRESIDQVKDWLKAGYAPCPNISCDGEMEVIQNDSAIIHA